MSGCRPCGHVTVFSSQSILKLSIAYPCPASATRLVSSGTDSGFIDMDYPQDYSDTLHEFQAMQKRYLEVTKMVTNTSTMNSPTVSVVLLRNLLTGIVFIK